MKRRRKGVIATTLLNLSFLCEAAIGSWERDAVSVRKGKRCERSSEDVWLEMGIGRRVEHGQRRDGGKGSEYVERAGELTEQRWS